MKLVNVTLRSLLITFLFIPIAWAAEGDGSAFAVHGERIDHIPPQGWKLAWMVGDADGAYVVEFIPESEDINFWQQGYLAIARMPYPTAEALKEVVKGDMKVSEVAVQYYNGEAVNACAGKFYPMSHRTNTFNGAIFSVSGGFCDKNGPPARFGEGAVFAYVEGKDYLFRIQYSWRPKSAEDKQDIPWRVDPEELGSYLKAIIASRLCGGSNELPCKENYVHPAKEAKENGMKGRSDNKDQSTSFEKVGANPP